MAKLIDRAGEVHSNLIIVKELGKNRVMAYCLLLTV